MAPDAPKEPTESSVLKIVGRANEKNDDTTAEFTYNDKKLAGPMYAQRVDPNEYSMNMLKSKCIPSW